MTTSKYKADRAARLRELPSIDSLLQTGTARSLAAAIGAEHLTNLARLVTEELRQEMLAQPEPRPASPQSGNGARAALLKEAEDRLASASRREALRGLRRVINATGVILHTNLGRAPLSQAAQNAILSAAGYCALEYDITTGGRGRRGARAEDLLAELTGAEAALVVNNCAAAALLVLGTFARGGETIVSRGELVEIGGDFRVPEVMVQSGTRMIEVGTTNRTRILDYRKAISPETRLVMRVHPSNYRIVGFTKTPTLKELAEVAHAAGLPLYEDAGSGALVDLAQYGISGEPVIRESIQAGADIVSFSGDKLLGGPQAGLIVGRAESIELMRKHPLYRALRADKLRIAALEATLELYRRGEKVPAHEMIAMTPADIRTRADRFVNTMRERLPQTLVLDTFEGESAIGGGSAPTSPLPTTLIAVSHTQRTANQLESALRNNDPAILVRIMQDRVIIDLRTVAVAEEAALERALTEMS